MVAHRSFAVAVMVMCTTIVNEAFHDLALKAIDDPDRSALRHDALLGDPWFECELSCSADLVAGVWIPARWVRADVVRL